MTARGTSVDHMVKLPGFGGGYYFRSWRMRHLAAGRLEVTMEDPAHALAMALSHDGKVLTAIEARWIRAPLSSCVGAPEELSSMIGCPLEEDLHAIARYSPPTLQCTHMLDALRLGITHLGAGLGDRRYDVVLPDSLGGDRRIELVIDGELAIPLVTSEDYVVRSPERFAGVSLFHGLAKWAAENVSPAEYRELFILQRAAFVARGADTDPTYYYNRDAREYGPPDGSCFGSQPVRYDGAIRMATARVGLTLEDALQFGI